MSTLTRCETMSAIPGMLTFGTATVVFSKILFQMSAHGKKFEKPWFQVNMMFLGMQLCLAVYFGKKFWAKRRAKNEELNGLLNVQEPKGDENKVSDFKQILKIYVPAMCDLLATGLMYIGFVYIPASIFQLMRGAMVVFSAILSVIFLKKKLYAFNWASIGLIVVALGSVGFACVKSGQKGTSQQDTIIGISLVVSAQLVQASQIVIEEFLLNDVKAAPVLIVGTEGFWGFWTCTLVLLPILYFVPEPYGENTINTFQMLGWNHVLVYITLIYIVSILFYNMFGMMVTAIFSAVHRTILEAMRTLCIWVADLLIYYVISTQFGERWTVWSWLELFGFFVLVFGTFMYNEVFRIPGFVYPDLKKKGEYEVIEE